MPKTLGEQWNIVLDHIGSIFLILGVMGGLGIVGYQCFLWLRFGEWIKIPASTIIPLKLVGWAYMGSEWLGIKKIVIWITELPLSLFVFIVGFLISIIIWGHEKATL